MSFSDPQNHIALYKNVILEYVYNIKRRDANNSTNGIPLTMYLIKEYTSTRAPSETLTRNGYKYQCYFASYLNNYDILLF